MKNYRAFTLAEILIALTIIGVITALVLPTLQGNIREKAWDVKKHAFYSRMSQAISIMPHLDDYGIEEGSRSEIAQKAAQIFVAEGLSSVFQISKICDNKNYADCNFPDKITILGGGKTIATPKKLSNLNTTIMYAGNPEINQYMIDSNAVAFKTVNGESVLAFYNPYCTSEDLTVEGQSAAGKPGLYHKIHVCANFIFDINGTKAPNTVGKDIGFISALYPTSPSVVMATPMVITSKKYKQPEIVKACRDIDEDYTAPNYDEAVSLYYNNAMHSSKVTTWTTTAIDADHAYFMDESYGIIYPDLKKQLEYVICIKR